MEMGTSNVGSNRPSSKSFSQVPLTSPWEGVDPFLFCSRLLENYPAGDGQLGINSPDANGIQSPRNWKMYHGTDIPGFPAHPHRGFETVTIVPQGLVDHADSLGASARYGEGDVQWLTTGKGVEHGEMFPLLHTDRRNTLELFQIWLNLSPAGKKAPAEFKMFWANDLPVYKNTSHNGADAEVQVIAGDFVGPDQTVRPIPPPTNSWAADPVNDVAIWLITIQPGGSIVLPPTTTIKTQRTLYYYTGDRLTICGEAVEQSSLIKMYDKGAVEIMNDGNQPGKILVLQGVPIGQPVIARGPFVLNSEQELMDTYREFQTKGFGKWPWPSREQTYGQSERFAAYPDGTRVGPNGNS